MQLALCTLVSHGLEGEARRRLPSAVHLDGNQCGFRRGRSTQDTFLALQSVIGRACTQVSQRSHCFWVGTRRATGCHTRRCWSGQLQRFGRLAQAFGDEWRSKANIEKTVAMLPGNGAAVVRAQPITVRQGKALCPAETARYLGRWLTHDRRWSVHARGTLRQATRAFYKWAFGLTSRHLSVALKRHIRVCNVPPFVEHGIKVWRSPATDALRSIWRRARCMMVAMQSAVAGAKLPACRA